MCRWRNFCLDIELVFFLLFFVSLHFIALMRSKFVWYETGMYAAKTKLPNRKPRIGQQISHKSSIHNTKFGILSNKMCHRKGTVSYIDLVNWTQIGMQRRVNQDKLDGRLNGCCFNEHRIDIPNKYLLTAKRYFVSCRTIKQSRNDALVRVKSYEMLVSSYCYHAEHEKK